MANTRLCLHSRQTELTVCLPALSSMFSCHECGLGQYMPPRAPGCVPGTIHYVQYQLDPRQQVVDGCRGSCVDCPPGWTDLDLGVCARRSESCVDCFVSAYRFHGHVLNCALACADPDTPCVPCGDNTYAPIPGTRGQCPLCSEVPNSGTIRDADVRPAPAISHLLFRLLRAVLFALSAYSRIVAL